METELARGSRCQQMVIEQGGEGFFGFCDGTAAQGCRGMRADLSARAQAQTPEESLVSTYFAW